MVTVRNTSGSASLRSAEPAGWRGRSSRRLGTAGFTLLEALIATVLGALVIALVLSTMMAQGGFYGDVRARAETQETVRAAVDLMKEELQGVTRGGVETARADQLVVRVPVAMGVICTVAGKGPPAKGPPAKGPPGKGGGGGGATNNAVFLPLPGGGVEGDRVSGYGLRPPGGEWSYQDVVPGKDGGGDPMAECEAMGAETAGAEDEFWSLTGFAGGKFAPSAGGLIALVSEVEFGFADSELMPGRLALFRRESDGDDLEVASGFLDGSTGFQYRLEGGTTFQDQVTGMGNLRDIVEIRILAVAESQDSRGAQGPVTYEWDIRIPLRNVP